MTSGVIRGAMRLDKKEKILFCTHSVDNGGAAKSLSILVKYLPSRYWAAIVSLREPADDSPYIKFYQDRHVPVFVFPFGWLPVSYINCPINVEAQKKRMERMRPNLAQLRWIGASADYICFNGYPAASIAPYFEPDIPRGLIAREIICEAPESSTINGFLRLNVKKAVAIGPMESAQLSEIGINNRIVFNSAQDPPEYITPPSFPPVRFAVFSRFGPDKGLDTLCEAARLARHRLKRSFAHISIYGANGIQSFGIEEKLNRFISENDLCDILSLEPWRHDIDSVIKEAHCIIRPDKSGSPWGRDIIEAMSFGRPVVASGSLDIFVKPEQTGWLFPPGEPQPLAKILVRLAENPELLVNAGKQAITFARTHFNPVNNTESIAEFLFHK